MRKSILLVPLLAACVATPGWHAPGGPAADRVRVEVSDMLESISRDLEQHGPLAWLDHFDDPAFFMATDGVLQFRDHAEAEVFLGDFAPNVTSMHLHWIEPRIVPLTAELAEVGAAFGETISLADGRQEHFAGYFTGVARRTPRGWRLGHGHWSSPPASAPVPP
ncbi:MAG: nuclear transport factor 2 family protein [Planctomycetes bacterium]|nr:nuclear transport factor 2 family protein [Planctomycetota bacterium]